MRSVFFTIGLLACLVAFVAAWSKEDQEIFRLRDEIEKHEGAGTSFYDFIGAKANVNQEDLNKAYKKRSRELHPDKVKRQFIAEKSTGKDKPKTKNKKPAEKISTGPSKAEINAAAKAASDRFARLGLVNSVLKGAGRERYDHFLRNGFPTWKGFGYSYARFRPGLGTVLVGLFIFVGGAGHYIALYMSWKRQQEFVGRYIKFARNAAWGDGFKVPGLDTPEPVVAPAAETESANEEQQRLPRNRRERRMMEKDEKKPKVDKKSKYAKPDKKAPAPIADEPAVVVGPKKRVVAENGKILVVDSVGNVYLEQRDAEGETHEFLLDADELQQPTWKSTALYRVPVWAYNLTAGRFLNKPIENEDYSEEEILSDAPDEKSEEDYELLEKSKTSEQNGNGKALKRSKKSGR